MSDNTKTSLNRREFFSYLTVGWVTFTAACAGFLGLAFRFSYPNVVFEPEMDFIAGGWVKEKLGQMDKDAEKRREQTDLERLQRRDV